MKSSGDATDYFRPKKHPSHVSCTFRCRRFSKRNLDRAVYGSPAESRRVKSLKLVWGSQAWDQLGG